MIIGFFVIAGFIALFSGPLAWEWLTGLALFGMLAALFTLNIPMAAVGIILLALCCWHWSRVA